MTPPRPPTPPATGAALVGASPARAGATAAPGASLASRGDRLAAAFEVLAGVAHELNNPLAGVLGYAELLLRREPPAEWRGDVEALHREASRCARLANDLLALARGWPGEVRPVDAGKLVREAREAVSARLAPAGPGGNGGEIRWEERLAAGLPAVLGDSGRLRQALVHVVRNACDAIEEFRGEGTIVVSGSAEGGWLDIAVEDDGPGMGPAVLGRLFEPFFTTRAPGRGIGLGLALVHAIVTDHRGEVAVKSRLGSGTSVRLRLPVGQGPPRRPRTTPSTLSWSRGALVVTGREDLANALSDALLGLRWRCHVAPTPAIAAALSARNRYDAALVDPALAAEAGPALRAKLAGRTVAVPSATVTLEWLAAALARALLGQA
ncbi:MAG: HAMP domain-containing histidine kinase [Planctomycetales bacterium]|nr:HAMP domain-containing histidine kinase [Planctomycetales bacterium]